MSKTYKVKTYKLLRDLKKILRAFNVKAEFSEKTDVSHATPHLESVKVGICGLSTQQIISTVFHELAHIVVFREGKYLDYHDTSRDLTKKKAKALLKTGLKIERYVDKRAKELMRQFYPDIQYFDNYKDPEVVAYYRRTYQKRLKDFLKAS